MKWGSNAQTLRTASLALVYSSAENCAPVLLNSAYVHKLDVQLNNVMRLITGTFNSTELQWLPVLSNIAPPKLRREAAIFRELKNSWINGKSLLFEQLQNVPALRLRSRNPIWIDDPGPTNTVYDLLERWKEMWFLSAPVHGDLVRDLTVEPTGFDLRCQEWVLLNRFRTSQGKCAFLMHRWGYSNSNATNYYCGHPCQTMNHIIDDCPIHAFADGLLYLHEATPEAIQYLSDLSIDL
jgi:hypothetical protein